MIYRYIFIFSLFLSNLLALDFKVASYNVENFFDLKDDGTEYKEYTSKNRYWNKKAYNQKLSNITKVINELDADILSLQEIESKAALKALQKQTNYKYSKFSKKSTSSVGVAILSKYPITNTSLIDVNRYNKYNRYILKTTIDIKGKKLILYTNHWRSKRAGESKRIYYANALKKDINKLKKSDDYIILGDLNSNYNEYETFKYDKKLNDTYGITGINQILNTSYNGNMIRKNQLFNFDKKVHYNLWLELNKNQRFSSKFRSQKNTPDNIIVSPALFDNKNISYVNNSFKVFKPKYLYNKRRVQRWNHKRSNGYSDHLPIYALFSTSNQNYNFSKLKKTTANKDSISSLYDIETINNPIILKDIVVIYKAKNTVIITKQNDRSIIIFKPSDKLKVGYKYDISIESLDRYNGLKEIKNISNIVKKEKTNDYKKYYKDGNKIDLFDLNNQNSVIKNLKGVYKKGHLYFSKNKKIKLYFKKGIKKPDQGKTITIRSGHLSIYKTKIQITIHHKSDISY